MMGRSGKPAWTEKIKSLRASLGMTQQDFAKQMNTFQTNVSAWESGNQNPSAETYLRLSELASSPSEALWFMQQAGLSRRKLLSIAGALLREQVAPPSEGEIVRVPLVAVVTDGSARGFVAVSADLVPNPTSTFAAIAADHFSEPLIKRGDTVLIDGSVRNVESLCPGLVAAKHEALDEHDRSPDGWNGLRIGWLERIDSADSASIFLASPVAPDLRIEHKELAKHRPEYLQDDHWLIASKMPKEVLPHHGGKLHVRGDVEILGRVIGWFAPVASLGQQTKRKKA